jgi:glycosyltransferase involved in cell wall biosynthesis
VRIALLTQTYPPMVSGAALVVQRLAQGLTARGHAVLVVAASERGPAYVERSGQLMQARLPALPNPLRARQRFSLWPRGPVRRALRAFQPDVLHLHDPTTLGLLGLRAGRKLRLPVVLTLHQLPWFVLAYLPKLPPLSQPTEAWLWRYYRWWIEQVQASVAPSATIAGIVQAQTTHRPLTITNGVDSQRFNPHPPDPGERAALLARYGLRPDLPIILYAGRIDADKQVPLVVQAAARALRATPAQLLVVGDGKERPAVERLCATLGIEAQSCFPGFVSLSGDLPGLYRLATVFVTASEVEIQSSVVLEAAASGLPVVAVRASSMPEFVEDGVTGYLVRPGDVEAMAGRLAALLRDPAQAQAMGQAALRLAGQHSGEVSVRAHEALYQKLVAGEVPVAQAGDAEPL